MRSGEGKWSRACWRVSGIVSILAIQLLRSESAWFRRAVCLIVRGLPKEKEPTAPQRAALRALQVGGRRNAAEQDEKIQECAEEIFPLSGSHWGRTSRIDVNQTLTLNSFEVQSVPRDACFLDCRAYRRRAEAAHRTGACP